ncbi:MAG: hypothetical protein ACKVVP_17865, partial [Chloroflexota bacterium]
MRSGAKVQTTAVLLLTGCSGAPSTLEPVGPRGQLIAEMWWITFGASMAVFVLVMAALGYALVRRRAPEIEARLQNDPKSWVSEPSRIANNRFVLAGGVALPVIVLTPILVYTFVSLGALAVPATPVAFPIEVIGHQYWWSVRYPSRGFVTANEVRVPIGQPIELRLSSSDVIHSFWVPQVMG